MQKNYKILDYKLEEEKNKIKIFFDNNNLSEEISIAEVENWITKYRKFYVKKNFVKIYFDELEKEAIKQIINIIKSWQTLLISLDLEKIYKRIAIVKEKWDIQNVHFFYVFNPNNASVDNIVIILNESFQHSFKSNKIKYIVNNKNNFSKDKISWDNKKTKKEVNEDDESEEKINETLKNNISTNPEDIIAF